MHARSLLTALGALGFMTLGAEARAGCTRRVKTKSVTATVQSQTSAVNTPTITTPGGVTSTAGSTTTTISVSSEGDKDSKTTTATGTASQPTTLLTSTQTQSQSSDVISVTTTTTQAQSTTDAASTTTQAQSTTDAASTTTTAVTPTHTGTAPSVFLPVFTPTWWQEVTYGTTLKLTWTYDSYYSPLVNVVFIAGDYQDAQVPVKTFSNVDASSGSWDFEVTGDIIYKDPVAKTFWPVYGFHVVLADDTSIDQWSNPFQIDVASGFPKARPVRSE